MNNIIGIYPGSFQPPHMVNVKVYQTLKSLVGENTFVATSDVVEYPNSPLSFKDKQQIWAQHGVPIDKIVMVKDPYLAIEITKKFGADRTSVVFAVDKLKAQGMMNGSEGRFEMLPKDIKSLEPMNKKAYIYQIPDTLNYINGVFLDEKLIKRALSSNLSDDKKRGFFKFAFGWFDIGLFDYISKKFSEAAVVKERVNESYQKLKEFIRTIVAEEWGQFTIPQGDPQQIEQPPVDPNYVKEKEKEKERDIKSDKLRLKSLDDKNKIDNKMFKQDRETLAQKIKNNKI